MRNISLTQLLGADLCCKQNHVIICFLWQTWYCHWLTPTYCHFYFYLVPINTSSNIAYQFLLVISIWCIQKVLSVTLFSHFKSQLSSKLRLINVFHKNFMQKYPIMKMWLKSDMFLLIYLLKHTKPMSHIYRNIQTLHWKSALICFHWAKISNFFPECL